MQDKQKLDEAIRENEKLQEKVGFLQNVNEDYKNKVST